MFNERGDADARFEVLAVVNLDVAVCCDMASCSLLEMYGFSESATSAFRGKEFSAPKREAASFSKTSLDLYHTT